MQKKIVIEKDGVKKTLTFRKILLNKCQEEFEKERFYEKKISKKQGLSVSTSNYCFAFSF